MGVCVSVEEEGVEEVLDNKWKKQRNRSSSDESTAVADEVPCAVLECDVVGLPVMDPFTAL